MNTQSGCVPSPEDPRNLRNVTNSVHARLRLITWAGRDPGLTPPNKAVILAVVAHTDEHDVCTASDHALARASHTSVPTVQRSLRLFEASRVIERADDLRGRREIRLIPGEQPLVVVVDDLDSLPDRKNKQQQEQQYPTSPAIIPIRTEMTDPEDCSDHDAERLVSLLTAWKVTAKVARELVRDYPERIIPQVEAHRHRNVSNPAGSLVAAIRDDWPTEPPTPILTAEEKREAARRGRDAERQAALDAQATLNARKRAESERVEKYWEGLSQGERKALEEEAVEASPDRDNILNHGPNSPIYTLLRVAARREHLRRKLGLPPVDES